MVARASQPSHLPTCAGRRAPAIGLLAVGLALAVPAAAGMVPGGGNATSDCYAELDVFGVEGRPDAVKRKKKVTCVDGDVCDTGPCGDGVCDFRVRLCWNQDDPQLAACLPPPRLQSLQLRGQLAALMVVPEDLDGAACSGDYVDFPVATRGIRRAGRAHVRLSAKAPDGTVPPSDADWIRLVCVPRSFETCPMPTTTSTTSVPATTIPGETTTTSTTSVTTTTRQTTTTRRRRTTTTTTASPPTTTFVFPTTTLVPTTTTLVVPTTTIALPTTLPTVTLPATTTLVAATTTPSTTGTTTTTRRRRGDDGDDDLVGIDLPLL